MEQWLAPRDPASVARLAGTTVLALSPFLFILGLQPFAYGIWFQAEPITVGLLTLGAAAGVCLLLLDLTYHRVWPVFREPPLLCLLALILWSAVISPLQEFPRTPGSAPRKPARASSLSSPCRC